MNYYQIITQYGDANKRLQDILDKLENIIHSYKRLFYFDATEDDIQFRVFEYSLQERIEMRSYVSGGVIKMPEGNNNYADKYIIKDEKQIEENIFLKETLYQLKSLPREIRAIIIYECWVKKYPMLSEGLTKERIISTYLKGNEEQYDALADNQNIKDTLIKLWWCDLYEK